MAEISNPASTGGSGTNFEIKVQAIFIASMITRAPCPCLPEGNIEKLYFQVRRMGFQTDDLLVKTRTQAGTEHKLLCQIKRNLNFWQSENAFKEILIRAWSDSHLDKFSKENDAIAIITGPQTTKVINHFRPLMQWARQSASAEEFFQKIETPNFSSDEKRGFIKTIREILAESEQPPENNRAIWQFLSVLHLLSYDFESDGSQDLTRTLQMLQTGKKPNSQETSKDLWLQITEIARQRNQTGGEIFYSNLGEKLNPQLKAAFGHLHAPHSIQRLKEHTQIFLNGISDEFAPNMTLKRSNIIDELINKIEQKHLVVTGEAGGGKSVIAKHIAERLKAQDWPVFAFRVEEFDYPHLHQAFNAMGINDDVQNITAGLGFLPRCLFIIDSVERLFESRHDNAFIQFIQTVTINPTWRIMLVCRSENVNNIFTIFPDLASPVEIPQLNLEEINQVVSRTPNIASSINDEKIREIAKIPFYLKLLFNHHTSLTNLSPQQIKRTLWLNAVEMPTEQQDGMPQRRRESFIQIAVRRAKNMSMFVRVNGIDAKAVQYLLNDNLIRRNRSNNYAPTQDLFEDLALYEHIEHCFDSANGDWKRFFSDVGSEPALRRAFRNWLISAITERKKSIYQFAIQAFENSQIPKHWRDEIIVGILKSETDAPEQFMQHTATQLLENGKKLFKHFTHLLRVACKGRSKQNILNDSNLQLRQFFDVSFPSPQGRGWEAIIHFISSHLDDFDLEESDHIVEILSDWIGTLNLNKPLPPEAEYCARIAFKYFNLLTDDSKDTLSQDLLGKYLEILLKIPQAARDKIQNLYEPFLSNTAKKAISTNIPSFIPTREYWNRRDRLLIKYAIKWDSCIFLCRFFPEIPIAILNYTLSSSDKYNPSPIDMECYFGLDEEIAGSLKFFPASALQGPFFSLLLFHPQKAISFLIEFFNRSCEFYVQSSLDGKILQVILKIEGAERYIYTSQRLWQIYRGTHVAPNILESALMAFEAWLLSEAEKEKDISPWINQIYQETNSVALIAALTSVASAYPNTFGKNILPLLATPEFYTLDLQRWQQEQGYVSDIRSAMGVPNNPLQDFFYDERKKSDEKPHRKNNLQNLMLNTQLSNLRDSAFKIVDDMKANLQNISSGTEEHIPMQFLLKNIDLREFGEPEETEDGKIIIHPQNISSEMQKRSDEAQKNLNDMNRVLRIFFWGKGKFFQEEEKGEVFKNWNDALIEIKEIQRLISNKQIKTDHINTWQTYYPPAWIAAVLVRYYCDELNTEDIQWCIGEILSSFEGQLDNSTPEFDITHGSRPAAMVLPLLLDICTEDIKGEIRSAIIYTLTAGNQSIREYAVYGAKVWLWERDQDFAQQCFLGLLELVETRNRWLTEERRHSIEGRYQELDYLKPNQEIRDKIISETLSDVDISSLHLDLNNHWDIIPALNLFPLEKVDDTYIQLIINILNDVVENKQDHDNLFELHQKFSAIFAELIIRTGNENTPNQKLFEALKNAAQSAPELASEILIDLIQKEDQQTSGERFWNIWNGLAEIILKENIYYKLLRAFLFTEIPWRQGIAIWEPLQNHPDIINRAFKAIGHTPEGFAALLQMTNTIGKFLLPDVLITFEEAWQRAVDPQNLLRGSNYRYAKQDLESLLRYCILNQRTELLSSTPIKNAAMNLLDHLIDQGSATAYQLRELII